MKFKIGDFIKEEFEETGGRCVIDFAVANPVYIVEYENGVVNPLPVSYVDAHFVLSEADFVPKRLAPKAIPPTSIEVLGAELSVTLLPGGRFGVFDTDALTDYTAPQLEAAIASLQAILETLRLLNAVVDPA